MEEVDTMVNKIKDLKTGLTTSVGLKRNSNGWWCGRLFLAYAEERFANGRRDEPKISSSS
jgi:hypothetical protein